MSRESATPDLVELVRGVFDAAQRGDFDATLRYYAPDAVWDNNPLSGLGAFEGHVAIRGFWEDWYASYEELEIEPEEILALGNEVTFSPVIQRARPIGSAGYVQLRYATVVTWVEGLIVRVTNYSDIDAARAAAERLAEERAQADV
ncbi:MAG TPA: nuclear transport factor 2 family protein [Solirubrobacteraceae bacterium]|nr:nuclear transport factor 2 family protein [Solirubrobacteraceae bacterium]